VTEASLHSAGDSCERALPYPDEAVMEVQADEGRSDAGVVPEGGGDGLLHDGLGGGARPVVEADVEAGAHGGARQEHREGRSQA
jgi:hypothetical protein